VNPAGGACSFDFRLPDVNATPTAKFKQVTTVTVPTSTDGTSIEDETVIMTTALPSNGILIGGSGVVVDDASMLRVYPVEYQKRRKFVKNAPTSASMWKFIARVTEKLRNRREHILGGKRLSYPEALTTGSVCYGGFQSPLRLENNPIDSYWNHNGRKDTACMGATAQVYVNNNIETAYYQYTDEFGSPIATSTIVGGTYDGACAVDAVITSGDVYAWALDVNGMQSTQSASFILRRGDDQTIIGSSSATPAGTLNASRSIYVTASVTYSGPVFWTINVTSTTAGGPYLQIMDVAATFPINPSSPNWYMVPTPDAATIMDATDGTRVCAQELLTTFVGSTLNDNGQIVCAKLPCEFWKNHGTDDLTFATIANLPKHYDGRYSEGGRSILPPYGPQQSAFLDENDDFFF